MIFEYVKPFGFTLATLMVLGGPNLIRDLKEILSDAQSVETDEHQTFWIHRMVAAESKLLRIDWKRSAPVIFCNKYSLKKDDDGHACE